MIASGPGQLPGLLGTLAPWLQHYGYLLVAVLIFVEDFGVLVPGETVLIAAAADAGAGRLSIAVVALVAAAAAILGDTVGYGAGHALGRARVLRWGRYLLLTERRLAAAEKFFAGNGGRIVAVARFVDGLRQVNGIVAGITAMPLRRFLACNVLGAVAWVGTWSAVGYLAGNHLLAVYQQMSRYALIPLAAAGVVPLVLGILARRRHRRRPPAGANPDLAGSRSGSDQGRSRWPNRPGGRRLES